ATVEWYLANRRWWTRVRDGAYLESSRMIASWSAPGAAAGRWGEADPPASARVRAGADDRGRAGRPVAGGGRPAGRAARPAAVFPAGGTAEGGGVEPGARVPRGGPDVARG